MNRIHEDRTKTTITAIVVLLALLLVACNYLLVPEITITCGPSVVPERLWPTPMPYP